MEERDRQMLAATLAAAIIGNMSESPTPEIAVKIKAARYWELYPNPEDAGYRRYLEAKASHPRVPWMGP